jgi:hypothetical protein
LSTSDRLTPWKRKGPDVNPCPPPPPLGSHEITHVWVRLPAVNRHRLMGLLSQLRERQLIGLETPGEDSHDAGPSH